MSDSKRPIDPASHGQQRNFVESILNWIPGFHGYLQKDYRQESDHLARTWLADRLQRAKRPLDDYLQTLVAQLKIDDLPQYERLRTKLDTLISKLRGDVRGYSGFFDYVRIDEAKLDEVYELDMALIEDVDRLAQRIERLATTDATPATQATELLREADNVADKYQRRGDLLKGLET